MLPAAVLYWRVVLATGRMGQTGDGQGGPGQGGLGCFPGAYSLYNLSRRVSAQRFPQTIQLRATVGSNPGPGPTETGSVPGSVPPLSGATIRARSLSLIDWSVFDQVCRREVPYEDDRRQMMRRQCDGVDGVERRNGEW